MSVVGKRIHDVEHAAETLLLSLGLLFVPVGTPSSAEQETEALESEPEVSEDLSVSKPSWLIPGVESLKANASLVNALVMEHYEPQNKTPLACSLLEYNKPIKTKTPLVHSLVEQHVHAALNLIIPSGDHELKEKEELAEAFVKIIEAKGRERGLLDEEIGKLREHLCSAADKWLKV